MDGGFVLFCFVCENLICLQKITAPRHSVARGKLAREFWLAQMIVAPGAPFHITYSPGAHAR